MKHPVTHGSCPFVHDFSTSEKYEHHLALAVRDALVGVREGVHMLAKHEQGLVD